MNPQLKAALIRGLILGVVSGLTALFALLGSEPLTLFKGVGSAFMAPLAARFGGEGIYDMRRQTTGKVKDGDVKKEPSS